MSTITTEQQQAIAKLLATMTLPTGMGTRESACSVAAINLALTGELTDRIPECMSVVIGKWIIGVQDAMPYEMRNSTDWKRLLPLAAGTGCQHEKERIEIIMDWMWRTVLPTLQPIADRNGFGKKWRIMLCEKTRSAATTATTATANATAATAAAAATTAANAATAAAAANATAAATAAANAATTAANATAAAANATAAANAAAGAAYYTAASYDTAAANAAATAASYAAKATSPDAWHQLNPCGLLERLIAVSQTAH